MTPRNPQNERTHFVEPNGSNDQDSNHKSANDIGFVSNGKFVIPSNEPNDKDSNDVNDSNALSIEFQQNGRQEADENDPKKANDDFIKPPTLNDTAFRPNEPNQNESAESNDPNEPNGNAFESEESNDDHDADSNEHIITLNFNEINPPNGQQEKNDSQLIDDNPKVANNDNKDRENHEKAIERTGCNAILDLKERARCRVDKCFHHVTDCFF